MPKRFRPEKGFEIQNSELPIPKGRRTPRKKGQDLINMMEEAKRQILKINELSDNEHIQRIIQFLPVEQGEAIEGVFSHRVLPYERQESRSPQSENSNDFAKALEDALTHDESMHNAHQEASSHHQQLERQEQRLQDAPSRPQNFSLRAWKAYIQESSLSEWKEKQRAKQGSSLSEWKEKQRAKQGPDQASASNVEQVDETKCQQIAEQLINPPSKRKRMPHINKKEAEKIISILEEKQKSLINTEVYKNCKRKIQEKVKNAKRYEKNKDAILAYHAKYHEENKGAIKAYNAKHYKENRDAIKAYNAKLSIIKKIEMLD